jgi:hypothetical protein
VSALLVKNASVLVPIDDARREIEGGGFLAADGKIVQVGRFLSIGSNTRVLSMILWRHCSSLRLSAWTTPMCSGIRGERWGTGHARLAAAGQ